MSDSLRALVETDPVLTELREPLLQYRTRAQGLLASEFCGRLATLKSAAVAAGDQLFAKGVWCLETIGAVQDCFVAGFHACKDDRFYAAWCAWEQCEVNLGFLARHYAPIGNSFGLAHIASHLRRFQELFPYVLFSSPGFVIESSQCSTCGMDFVLRGGCSHRVGEIYDGEMCCRIISEVKLLEISLVAVPANKYTVAFIEGIPYNYGAIHYVVSGLRSPWDGWMLERIPAGEGRKGHVQILFEIQPPSELPAFLEKVEHYVESDGPEDGEIGLSTRREATLRDEAR